MKKLPFKQLIRMCILILFLFPSSGLYSQAAFDSTQSVDMKKLLEKGKKHKRMALQALGFGVGFIALSTIIGEEDDYSDEESMGSTEAFLTGALCLVLSGPLYISGLHKTHKARVALSVERQQNSIGQSNRVIKAGIYVPL